MSIEGCIEQNIDKLMNRFFGDRDETLKTITKLNLLYDGSDEMKNNIEKILTQIKNNNYTEAYNINKELSLTYDEEGNLVPCETRKIYYYDIGNGAEEYKEGPEIHTGEQ